MTKLSDLGPPIFARLRVRAAANEKDQFRTCPACGQAVDWGDLRQVIWHEQPGHARLEIDS
ncbi:hypothetical protein EOA60_02685 [Mesorhizobium sp. M1A.F.Ca.IN.020.06.1.1]|nr:hypothetical protein EOA60_02685 [Mesorhizobium sp. M1A.F.Ca.IN.020.06.1.1]